MSLLACGACGRPTVTGWCSKECRLSAAVPDDALGLTYEPPPLRRWRLVGRDGMTFPDQELTAEDASEWAKRKRGAYPLAHLQLVLVDGEGE